MTPAFSKVLITLMKGVTYQETDPALWRSLLENHNQVREYVNVVGLELILDESEGYAYLRQRPEAGTGEELPHLVPRRRLGYSVSLMIALLRKRLAEFDASSGETRLILSRDEIVNLVKVFLPESTNEARWHDRVGTDIKKIVEMGFLRPLRGQDDRFEVRRILKAFVDTQWLTGLNERLAEYQALQGSTQATVEDT